MRERPISAVGIVPGDRGARRRVDPLAVVVQGGIEFRSTGCHPRGGFGEDPAAPRGSERVELELGILVGGGDAGVPD